MLTYIALLNFTDKGAVQLRKTTARAEAFQKIVEKSGIKILQTYWLNGPFDGIHIFEVNNEDEAMVHSLNLQQFGNVRPQTFRAYTKSEIEPILARLTNPGDML